jgi:hypothetical protein
VVSAADPIRSLISVFDTGAATFLSSSSSFILTRAEWTPFQIHRYSENLIAPGIEPGTSYLNRLQMSFGFQGHVNVSWDINFKGFIYNSVNIFRKLEGLGFNSR